MKKDNLEVLRHKRDAAFYWRSNLGNLFLSVSALFLGTNMLNNLVIEHFFVGELGVTDSEKFWLKWAMTALILCLSFAYMGYASRSKTRDVGFIDLFRRLETAILLFASVLVLNLLWGVAPEVTFVGVTVIIFTSLFTSYLASITLAYDYDYLIDKRKSEMK